MTAKVNATLYFRGVPKLRNTCQYTLMGTCTSKKTD